MKGVKIHFSYKSLKITCNPEAKKIFSDLNFEFRKYFSGRALKL